MFLRSWLFVPGLISILFVVGCGGGSNSGPVEELVPVGGTLLVDGKPLDGVAVTFIPDVSKKNRGGSGTTDATGAFTVTHLGRNLPGLPPGKYTLAYSRMRLSDGSAAPKLKVGEPENPENIPIEMLPMHVQSPDPTLPSSQVEIPKNGNTKLELKVSTKKQNLSQ
ncbi:MAG: carboxypeptidase-like regulatory domain-containing protein [Gimesia sp.]|nr:carboxypeptidase-like regulatory domain-containing protein [Gimesia sp.]